MRFMKNISLYGLLILIFLINFANADLIEPGYTYLGTTNIIDNIQDFPDYTFLSICNPPMPRVSIIPENGILPDSCYKYSALSAYAIKTEEFNISELNELDLCKRSINCFEDYFNQSKFIQVIPPMQHMLYVPITDVRKEIINHFNISIEDASKMSKKTKTEYDWILLITYILLSLIALFFIIRIIKNRIKK